MADYRVFPGQLPVSPTEGIGQDADRRFDEQEKGLVDNRAAQMPTSAGYGSFKGPGEKNSFHLHSGSRRFTETRFPALQVSAC